MKVRLLSSLATPGRDYWVAGQEYECDVDEAGRLIKRGMAEPIREATPESMSRKAPERAVRPRAESRAP